MGEKKYCSKCGHEDGSGINSLHTMDVEQFMKCNIRDIMEETGWCYECAFFEELLRKHKDNPRWLIIDGSSWIAGNPAPETEVTKPINFLGCGGLFKKAKKFTGEIISSNNWWHQGEVSEAFKDVMPDNAVWID